MDDLYAANSLRSPMLKSMDWAVPGYEPVVSALYSRFQWVEVWDKQTPDTRRFFAGCLFFCRAGATRHGSPQGFRAAGGSPCLYEIYVNYMLTYMK
jgi:hypothetical protein